MGDYLLRAVAAVGTAIVQTMVDDGVECSAKVLVKS